MKVKLADQDLTIRAARPQVFRLFASFGNGQSDEPPESDQPIENGEGANVLEREGNRLLVEFTSRDGRKLYKTLEEVRLYPEERITFRHLNGPLHYASEEFLLKEVPEGTLLTYKGQIECRMPLLPGVGWLAAMIYVRPKYGSVVKRHMGLLKQAAESGELHTTS